MWARRPDFLAAAFSTFLVGQAVVWVRLYRSFWPRPVTGPWYQFSLRTLLALPVIVGIPLGWITAEIRRTVRHDRAVAELERSGLFVRNVWGRSYLDRYTMGCLFRYPMNVSVTNPMWFGANTKVSITDAGVPDLPDCGDLDLSKTAITDAGVSGVAKRVRRRLNLSNTQITDAGLKHLSGKSLDLNLDNTNVTDKAVPMFTEDKININSLSIRSTKITPAGHRKIKKAFMSRIKIEY